MTTESKPTKKYRVKLGLTEVTIECNSRDEAIRLARIKLTDDTPRLYDIILNAEDDRFDVNELPDNSAV